jgi:plastocyanin
VRRLAGKAAFVGQHMCDLDRRLQAPSSSTRRTAPLPAIATGVALVLAVIAGVGCGSAAAPGSSGASGSTRSTGATATTTSTPSSPNAGDTSSSGSSLKVTTTPKFAAPSSSQPVRNGTVSIAYRYYTIQPDTVRVRVGTVIRWTNYDREAADVTSVGGSLRIASRRFGENETFVYRATRPGVIHYESTDHPATMNGTIEVLS